MGFQKQFAEHPELREVSDSGRLPAAIGYHPRAEVESLKELPSGQADLAISRFVLEHVPQPSIRRMHVASHQWMKPGALWIHWISPSDHRAYSDKSLHLVDFLRYSEGEWLRIAGNRYAFHNRMRRPHYRRLFTDSGWTVELDEAEIPAQALASLGRLPIHPEFRDWRAEELVAGSLWFALGHPDHGG